MKKGFSLIELLTSVLVFSVVGGAFTYLLITSNRLIKEQKERAIALTHATYVAAKVHQMSLFDITTSNWESLIFNKFASQLLPQETVSVSYFPSSNSNPLGVYISVSWVGYGGQNKELDLATVKSEL